MPYVGQDYAEAAFKPTDLSVSSGATSAVQDLGPFSSVVAWSTGTPTMTPCDSSGNTLPGASAITLTVGTLSNRVSRYAKFTATGGALIVSFI